VPSLAWYIQHRIRTQESDLLAGTIFTFEESGCFTLLQITEKRKLCMYTLFSFIHLGIGRAILFFRCSK